MGTRSSNAVPVLWQLPVSHYSEKVRWALAHKGVEHRRRAPLPGTHMAVALWHTRGGGVTFPILQLDGRAIADSTAIIAALERRWPDPPLYPADPQERRRALELEEFFDEELGPHIRLLAFHELANEPQMFAEVAASALPAPFQRVKPIAGFYGRAYTGLRFGVRSEAAAALAREKVIAAIDRLDAELARGEGEFLVGDAFSVADLTAASLFYPLVIPAEGPLSPQAPTPPAFDRFRAELSERPGYRWVEETYRRRRRPVSAAARI